MKKLLSRLLLILLLVFLFSISLHSDSYLEDYQGFWLSTFDHATYFETVSARILGNRIELFKGVCTRDGIFTGYTLLFVAEDYLGNYIYQMDIKGAIDHSLSKNHKGLLNNFKDLKNAYISSFEKDGKRYLDIAFFDKDYISDLSQALIYYRLEFKIGVKG